MTEQPAPLPVPEALQNSIAIIGLAGRFPGAPNLTQFWQNLCDGVESIRHFSDAELEDRFPPHIRQAPNYVKARPILDDIEQFDAGFFGMYAKEAELTDPQHRLFLELAWEALEDGGHDPARYPGAIGVFGGCSMNSYFLNHVGAERATLDEFTSSYQVGCYPMLVGAGQDFLATRIAYKLNLRGPALTVQTACSTSLLAVAQACQSLQLYQCDMALAGAVSITLPQKRGYLHQEGGMVSEDGHCRTFDAAASGTIFGSGAGIVLLKRYEDALADGDHIYALIRGYGINNDGAGKVGFTAPSVEGQAAAIEMAQLNAGVSPRSISYVECHGTATPLGDPIEIAGLTRAFRQDTADCQFCAVGSVKPNVGHLDVAAGVAGLIKTTLALQHRQLPPTLHYRQPNPQIDFPASPFFVNAQLRPWPAGDGPRRAGVSAFGVGGTNVHLVLEEAPAAAPRQAAAGLQRLQLSARSPAALVAQRQRLAAHLQAQPQLPLADVAHTLRHGRHDFDHRCSLVASNVEEAIAALQSGEPPLCDVGRSAGHGVPVVFMFPGQGAQYPDMGRGLYDSEPEFRRWVDHCAATLQPLSGYDLRELLYPASDDPEIRAQAGERLLATGVAQPAIFTVEYATARLWQSRGLQPVGMIGHSVGEFVAAVLAGVISLEDALAVVAERGRLMQALPGGAMLAVRLPLAELQPRLGPELAIAAINGPALCVVAGDYAPVAALESQLAAADIVCRRLHTSHAFHSPLIEPMVPALAAKLAGIRLSPPQLPYISCVSGDWISAEQATSPQYWARHARETVHFAAGISRLMQPEEGKPLPLLLEVGPGNTLGMLALQIGRGQGWRVVASLPDPGRESSDAAQWQRALGQLWLAGVELPEPAAADARRVSLPTYPFERSRYWIKPAPAAQPAAASAALPVLQPASFSSPFPALSTACTLTAPAAELVIATGAAPQLETAMPAPATPAEVLRQKLLALIEDLSGESVADAPAGQSFLEMGFDSLFLSQLAQKIQNQLKVKLTFRQLLAQYPTLDSLGAYLLDKVPAALLQPPAPAVAPLVAPVSPAAAIPASPAPQRPLTAGGSGVEALLQQQMQAMSQLFESQLATLRQLGQGGALAAPQAAALGATLVTPSGAAAAPAEPTPALTIPSAELGVGEETRPSRFQVYQPGQASSASELSPAQQQHLAELIARYTTRSPGSRARAAQYRPVLADPRAAAGFRSEWKDMVYPIVVERCAGAHLWDVDGNDYVDLVNGYGQTAFGHAPDFVVAAVKAQLDKGFAIGPQAELAGQVATLFAELTGNERVTFCNTGSEAVMAAMRVARTVTGRDKVVVFNGDYHGQFDEVLVKGLRRGGQPRSLPVASGIPEGSVANMVVLEYGTPDSLNWLRQHADDLAAVVVEPVQSRHPALQPWDFLREVRAITAASGTAFVMDEVVTGFRVHPGGIQGLTGIRADLATYGKVVGGGMPVGILAGRAEFMDALDGGLWQYGDDSFPETAVTFFAGTFVRHPLVLAALWAVLNHLKEAGPALQENLARRTTALVERLNGLFAEFGLKTRIEHFSSFFYFNFYQDSALGSLFYYHLREKGVHIHEGFPCFLTTAHSDADLDHIVSAWRQSLGELAAVGLLGTPPLPAELPLTESQMEVWLAAQLGDEASCAFNESVSLHLAGSLDRGALQAALTTLVSRHDALRARFGSTGEAMQISPPAAEFPLPQRVIADAEAQQRVLHEEATTPFNLADGPCFRARLLERSNEEHILILTGHHIICDGWSINILVNELAELYRARLAGAAPELAPALSFARYAQDSSSPDVEEQARTDAWWLAQFPAPLPPLQLPGDRPRSPRKSFKGASLSRRIDAGLYQLVKQTGARHGSTLFATLLATFQLLIGRLAGQDEVVVGVPTAGQSLLEDGGNLVGHCVNFLPIRGAWQADTPFAQHLAAVSRHMLEAQDHPNTTLGRLVRQLNWPRQENRVPLAEIQFNLEKLADGLSLPGLQLSVTPNDKAAVNFDLFLNIIESSAGLRLDCDYNTDLFDAATIARWLEAYTALLRALVADPQQPMLRADWLEPACRRFLLEDCNASAVPLPLEESLVRALGRTAARRAGATALRFGEQSLSYAELEQRSNRLARLLQQRLPAVARQAGQPRQPRQPRVGVCVSRSLDTVVALLAVWKAGCAYVPLDPGHPPARLGLILGEAQVAALIADSAGAAAPLPAGTPCLHLQQDAAALAATSDAPLPESAGPDDLAYVIYTSGSTGRPKGVEIPQRALLNLLYAMAARPGCGENDTLFAVTTISFDIAALELFLPLLVGGSVVICPAEAASDGFQLLAGLQASGATLMQATPATWQLLLEAGFESRPGLKLLVGGEALPRPLANRLLAGGGELWNMYGPTETTVWSSCARITAGEAPIGIGEPIANTQFYVLDRHDQLLPPGVPGQLHIGGTGLARGYFARPELTAEKFIANPFGPGRLYRTGDLARRLPDGSLLVLGRSDHQIKLRGFRIELGEIEARLQALPGVSAAAVLLREDSPGQRRLVAYVAGPTPLDPARLREGLARDLPDYMLPAAWLQLPALPLSPNGKVDRAALPAVTAMADPEQDFVAPLGELETRLAAIVAEVLEIPAVSATADLFELGADSIHLFRITARAQRAGLALTARQLLQLRHVRAVAAALAPTDAAPVEAVPEKAPGLRRIHKVRAAQVVDADEAAAD